VILSRQLVCAALLLVACAVYWRAVAMGYATTDVTVIFWASAIAWCVKLEVYRIRARRPRAMRRVRP
jgi:hypothetical protein